MSVWTSTPTQKGLALQGKLLSTDTLEITRVVSGAGSVTIGQLAIQTAISNIKQELTVESLTYDESGNGLLRVRIDNYALQTGYSMKQIGIYANDPDEGEILYVIAQVTDVAEEIPSITEQPAGFTCGWVFHLNFCESSNISINITPGAFITSETADLTYAKKSELSELKENLVGKKDVKGEIFNAYDSNTATGDFSHAEGFGTVAGGNYSHAGGNTTKANGYCSFTHGSSTQADGICAFASGYGAIASGNYSFALGNYVNANDGYSYCFGVSNSAYKYQFVVGKYADVSSSADKGALADTSATSGSLFTIGNGTAPSARTNVFRVSASGRCYGSQAFGSSGADYAEFFEWLDGNPDNEDRRGFFVTLDGENIRIATSEDKDIIGVVSATPSVIGDVHSEAWKDMFLRDVFGERMTETVTVPESVDELTGETIPEHTVTRWILNPEYDSSKGYLSRDERQEWAAIGLMGKLIVVDDGTCKVNGYCSVSSNGTATASETGYRVMKRIDDTHIKILFR